MIELPSPDCPRCGSPPAEFSLMLATQWVCPNDDCTVFMWDPHLTRAQLEADPMVVDFPDPPGPTL